MYRGAMRKTFALLLAMSLLPLSAAHAESPPASPLLGTWSVDVSRLPVPAEVRPKSVTITFNEEVGGKWTTRVEIIGGNGSARRMASTYSLDGLSVLIVGDQMEADSAAVRMPVPGVMVVALAKDGTPASTRVYTVAHDGHEMVETAVYFDDSGRAVMRTNYFSRVR